MGETMIDLLQKSIKQQYYLLRNGRDWVLADGVNLRAPNRYSLGFSLDNSKNPPLAFFSENPPADIAKMCDAIIVLPHKSILYFFIIEQKTSNKGDYRKQLANGKFFCQWLVSLYCHHGYCDAASVQYIGMLIWQPRQSPSKGEMTHRRKPAPRKTALFPLFFDEPAAKLMMLVDYLPVAD